MSETCNCCGWRLDDQHDYNVNCATANASYDQILAEVDECNRYPWTERDEHLMERAMEVVRDVLAYARFKRNLR